MLSVIWQWLKLCWKTRPRWEKCAVCGRRIWVYGEPAPTACSKPCGLALQYEMGVWEPF